MIEKETVQETVIAIGRGKDDPAQEIDTKKDVMMIEDLLREEMTGEMTEAEVVLPVDEEVEETQAKKAIMISLARREGALRLKELFQSRNARDLGLLGMLDHLALRGLLLCKPR